jgi:methionyl-tRNA formyltransferase
LKNADVQASFNAHAADIAVVAAYGLLLPQAVLDAPRLGCINIHPSDLPRWRGAAPIQRTLMAGDRTTASCIIQLEAGLDTGPIHLREPFLIPDGMDAGTLHDSMAAIGARQIIALLDHLSEHPPGAQPQADTGITYADKIGKDDRPAHTLRQQILGLAPSPCATAILAGETVKLYDARVEAGKAAALPGEIIDDQLLIQCGDGQALRPTSLQRPGKNRQDLAQFIQGLPLFSGAHAK